MNEPGRNDIDNLTNYFTKHFLKNAVKAGGDLKDYHVIFSFGTVVRLNNVKLPEDYKLTYDGDFPTHRVKDEKEFFKQAEQRYNHILENNSEYTDIIKKGYYKLITSGYPYPGGEGGDSIYIPMDDFTENDKDIFLIGVIFPQRGDLITIEYSESEDSQLLQKAHMIGRENRRYDYMIPKAYAIIEPNLNIIKLK